MRALGPAAALRGSLALLRHRAPTWFALGLALYTSGASVCCGLGVVAAPWFACELSAVLISNGTRVEPVRTRAWLWAGVYQMVSLIVVTSVALLALMALAAAQPLALTPRADGGMPVALVRALGVGSVAGMLVLTLTAHFQYAPLILIERGGGLIAALLESARLVALAGLLRTFALSVLVHGLPMLCAIGVIGLLALRATLAASVLFIALLLPLLVLALVVGQGMLVASYLALRGEATDPQRVPLGGEPSKAGTAVWAVLLGIVAIGPLLVSLSLLKPAAPSAASLPSDHSLLFTLAPDGTAVERYVQGTALLVRVAPREVRVVASDGGGAGPIPLPAQEVRRVRVAQGWPPGALKLLPRGESTFAIEVELADGRLVTSWIDEAGVRLDDTWERRLAQRLAPLSGLVLVLCFGWTAAWIARALPPQARIRRRLSGKRPLGAELSHEHRLRAALRARVIGASLWLLPPALASFAIGLSALLR